MISGFKTKTVNIKIKIRKIKKCKWCGEDFTPKSNHNLYCSKDCSKYASMEHTTERVRRYRKKYREVLKESRQGYKVGTGMLHAHPSDDFDEEWEKVQNEMKYLGLRQKEISELK